MKRILSRLAVIGIVAAGALGTSVATSWSCAPGSTDCPVDQVRPGWGGDRPGRPDVRPERPDWRPDAGAGRPDWRPDDRPGRPQWRPDRDNRPRWDRYQQPRRDPDRWRDHGWRDHGWRDRGWRDRPSGGIYLNLDLNRYAPGYDDGYYVDPRPRYRVRLSAAHVEWCSARYKTYRASDNTFKPTRDTRRQCISPYS